MIEAPPRTLSPMIRMRALLGLASATLLIGCATPLQPAIRGYSCCNLRAESGWVSRDNVVGGAFIPAGEPASFDSIKRHSYVYGKMGGQDIALRDDTARNKDDALNWVRLVIVHKDPRPLLASWSPEVQQAVRAGKVRVGMTQPQVLMALGYPSPTETKDLNSKVWRYWTAQDDELLALHFGADGTLSSLRGGAASLRALDAGR